MRVPQAAGQQFAGREQERLVEFRYDIEVFVSIQDSETGGTVALELEASAPGVIMTVAENR